jgi:GTP pyrophosphokinase
MLKRSDNELKKLLAIVKKNYPDCDSALIQNAFLFAKKAHRYQFRQSKQPFFIHPVATAFILAELGADCKTVAAALLHDVLEDTRTKPAQLKGVFGADVLRLVQGVTKLSEIAEQKQSARATANLQHLLLATTKEPRVIVIKLADKLHNLRTLRFLSSKDRKRIAAEALSVYAPIALRLGIHALYNEMSDLAFKFLKPDIYSNLKRSIKKKGKAQIAEINAMVNVVKKKAKKKNLLFDIDEKTVYAIYSKMQKKEKSLGELPDPFVLKIIVATVDDCYSLLGMLHSLFTPLPGKIKDYIALPQPNLYQALHTTVIGPKGRQVKVRIVTKEMQQITAKGIIAFWQLRSKGTLRLLNKNIALLAEVIGKSPGEQKRDFFDALKADFLAKTITVFSADGEAIELPAGATPIDFAFHFDKKSALRIWEAKVNGKFVSLSRKLESGDIVETISSSEVQVKESWLHSVKSFAAKKAIKAFLRSQRALWKQMPSIDLNVEVNDVVGVLAAISRALSSNGIDIRAASVGAMPNAKSECHFNLEFPSAEKLRKTMDKIKKIKDVKSVEIIYRE